MNRWMKSTLTLLMICAMSGALFAQQPPPPDGPPGEQRPGGDGMMGMRGGPGMNGPGMNGPGMNGPGMNGPGRGGRGGPGGFGQQPAPEMQKYEMLRTYIDVVDRFSKLAQDPTAAGVAAVVSATDILRQRGPEGAITYLSKTLDQVKNPTIQRAIRIQLADLYRQSGQSDKALEQLDALMKTP